LALDDRFEFIIKLLKEVRIALEIYIFLHTPVGHHLRLLICRLLPQALPILLHYSLLMQLVEGGLFIAWTHYSGLSVDLRLEKSFVSGY
jgi:hypothetical protein